MVNILIFLIYQTYAIFEYTAYDWIIPRQMSLVSPQSQHASNKSNIFKNLLYNSLGSLDTSMWIRLDQCDILNKKLIV